MDKFVLPFNNSSLEFTGERFVPGVPGEIELEHIHRYLFAAKICANKIVLDVASGEGFGSFMLAQGAKKVVGVDISQEAVANAKQLYRSSNLEYMVGSCQKIPLEDKSVEVVVSFETLEHITEHDDFFREIKRVLRPDGMLIMSTPDTNIYSNGLPTINQFHLKELTLAEFDSAITNQFKHSRLFGQKCLAASSIQNIEHLFSRSTTTTQNNTYFTYSSINTVEGNLNPNKMPYIIAIASEEPIADDILNNSFFEASMQLTQIFEEQGRVNNQLRDTENQLQNIANQLRDTENQLQDVLNSKSWKISAPLRALKSLLNSFRNRGIRAQSIQ